MLCPSYGLLLMAESARTLVFLVSVSWHLQDTVWLLSVLAVPAVDQHSYALLWLGGGTSFELAPPSQEKTAAGDPEQATLGLSLGAAPPSRPGCSYCNCAALRQSQPFSSLAVHPGWTTSAASILASGCASRLVVATRGCGGHGAASWRTPPPPGSTSPSALSAAPLPGILPSGLPQGGCPAFPTIGGLARATLDQVQRWRDTTESEGSAPD